MKYWRANLIAWIHFSAGTIGLFIYSMIASTVEQEGPQYMVPATLAAFGITMWAGCRCAYSYGLRDAQQVKEK